MNIPEAHNSPDKLSEDLIRRALKDAEALEHDRDWNDDADYPDTQEEHLYSDITSVDVSDDSNIMSDNHRDIQGDYDEIATDEISEEVDEEYIDDIESDISDEEDEYYTDESEDYIPEDATMPNDNQLLGDSDNQEQQAQERKSKKGPSLWSFLGEGVSNAKWLQRNVRLIMFICILFGINIYRRYSIIDKIEEVDKLEHELKDIQYRSLFKSSEVTASGQKLNIEKEVRDAGLNLQPSATPPYIIYRSSADKELKK